MPTYARIVDSRAVDVVTVATAAALAEMFHPDLIPQFSKVPAGTLTGATLTAGVWTNPAPVVEVPPPAPRLPSLEPMDFYLAFTPQERVAIKKSADPIVQEFWDTYQRAERANKPIDPNAPSVQQGLAYLAQPTTGILASVDRIAQILAGVAQ